VVKRDDLTGLSGGGNKVRKREWTIRAALDAEADPLVTTDGLQRNHARLAATVRAAPVSGLQGVDEVPNAPVTGRNQRNPDRMAQLQNRQFAGVLSRRSSSRHSLKIVVSPVRVRVSPSQGIVINWVLAGVVVAVARSAYDRVDLQEAPELGHVQPRSHADDAGRGLG
jgi:hypothetical protein